MKPKIKARRSGGVSFVGVDCEPDKPASFYTKEAANANRLADAIGRGELCANESEETRALLISALASGAIAMAHIAAHERGRTDSKAQARAATVLGWQGEVNALRAANPRLSFTRACATVAVRHGMAIDATKRNRAIENALRRLKP